MKSYFYEKQDYSEEGQKRKIKEIESSLDRRLKSQISHDFEPFNFKLICEEPSLFQKIKMIFTGRK